MISERRAVELIDEGRVAEVFVRAFVSLAWGLAVEIARAEAERLYQRAIGSKLDRIRAGKHPDQRESAVYWDGTKFVRKQG